MLGGSQANIEEPVCTSKQLADCRGFIKQTRHGVPSPATFPTSLVVSLSSDLRRLQSFFSRFTSELERQGRHCGQAFLRKVQRKDAHLREDVRTSRLQVTTTGFRPLCGSRNFLEGLSNHRRETWHRLTSRLDIIKEQSLSRLATLRSPLASLNLENLHSVFTNLWHRHVCALALAVATIRRLPLLLWSSLQRNFLLPLTHSASDNHNPFFLQPPLFASIASSHATRFGSEFLPEPEADVESTRGNSSTEDQTSSNSAESSVPAGLQRSPSSEREDGDSAESESEPNTPLTRARREHWYEEEGLKLQQDQAESDPSSPASTQIEALYVSHCKHYTPDVLTSRFTFKPWNEYWALLNTGEIYLGLPHGDPRTFDFEKERSVNPHRFVSLEHLDGTSEQGLHYGGRFVPFDPRVNTIAVNEGMTFKKVHGCHGCKLQGTYAHNAPRDFVESSEAFGLHGATSISFSKSGAFTVKGCTNICFKEFGGDENVGDEAHGKYKIRGNIIEFQYDTGAVQDAFFFEFPDSGYQLVSINGVTYTKQE